MTKMRTYRDLDVFTELELLEFEGPIVCLVAGRVSRPGDGR